MAFDPTEYRLTSHAFERIAERLSKELNPQEILDLVRKGKVTETSTHRYVEAEHPEFGVLRFPCEKDRLCTGPNRYVIKTVITPDMHMPIVN